jgi:chromosome segregation ATPase
MKLKLFAVLLLSISISSCSNTDKNKYITEINAMEITLDSLKSIANDTTKQNSTEIVMSVRQTIANVKKNYMPDTIDYDLAEKMNSYKEIRKVISRNSGNLAKAKQAIPEVQIKLADLKHDVENGVNDREKYEEYINYEKSKIEEIKTVLSYYLETTEVYYKRYDSLHPIIKNFGDSLERVSHD